MVGVKASDILQPLPLAHGFLAANDYSVGVVNNSVADGISQQWVRQLFRPTRDVKLGKRQTTPRMDRHETIVTGRCETFRYCHIGGTGMTSAELKHRAKHFSSHRYI